MRAQLSRRKGRGTGFRHFSRPPTLCLRWTYPPCLPPRTIRGGTFPYRTHTDAPLSPARRGAPLAFPPLPCYTENGKRNHHEKTSYLLPFAPAPCAWAHGLSLLLCGRRHFPVLDIRDRHPPLWERRGGRRRASAGGRTPADPGEPRKGGLGLPRLVHRRRPDEAL